MKEVDANGDDTEMPEEGEVSEEPVSEKEKYFRDYIGYFQQLGFFKTQEEINTFKVNFDE